MLELGASFKKAREGRNLSIEEIAAETRISSRFLHAIENEQFDLLPGGIFNRGFIRNFAERVGLDPDEAVRSYERLSRPEEVESRQEQQPARPSREPARPSIYYLAIAGLVIAVIAFYIVAHHRSSPVPPAVAAAPQTAPPPVTPSEAPPEAAPPVTSPSIAETEVAKASIVPVEAAPRTRSAPTPAPAPSNAEAPIVVEMEFQDNSWFKLSADGAPVVNGEILSRGASRRFTANQSINLSIGNAAGVTLRVNGQQVSSLGRNGQVRMLNITPTTSAASLAE